jgi:hypothetical protein
VGAAFIGSGSFDFLFGAHFFQLKNYGIRRELGYLGKLLKMLGNMRVTHFLENLWGKYNHSAMRSNILSSVALLGFVAGLAASPPSCLWAQPQARSAAAIIRDLTDLSPRSRASDYGVFSCGETENDRNDLASGRELVALGNAALPDIEHAINQIREEAKHGVSVPNGWLILEAYGRIKGPAAAYRLRELLDDPSLAFMRSNIDRALSLAFGITSYVSYDAGTTIPHSLSIFCGSKGPREVLNQLILSWEGKDEVAIERNLGPDARIALKSLLNGRTWTVLSTELWGAKPRQALAAGFSWSKPEELLARQGLLADTAGANSGIYTQFRNASGGACGLRRIEFAVEWDGRLPSFRINNTDLRDLLGLIATCASE